MAILHYTESGQGEPLILLHSGGMSGVEWIPQIPLFARNFRVIVPDHLGHGRSPMVAERLTIADMGRAVLDLISGALRLSSSMASSSPAIGPTASPCGWCAADNPLIILISCREKQEQPIFPPCPNGPCCC